MRKILLSFLMLIMLTPSLACAMPVCAEPSKGVAAVKMPCGDHMNMEHQGDKKDKKYSSGMLMKDCLGLELQASDKGPLVQKPDLSKDAASPMVIAVSPTIVWTPRETSGTRDPPDRPALSKTQISVLLTTQRFRL
jgi:hypothetical protein